MEIKKPSFVHKQIERTAYIFMLCSLAIGALTATLLTYFSFLIPGRKVKKKDFLFFPYSHKDHTATISRFQIYLPYLERDGYTYDIDYLYDEKYFSTIYFNKKSRTKEYLLFQRVFWHRLFKALGAGNYKAVFINRAMFPGYYDQRFAYLERLMSKLNNNITIDFFDAEYVRNKSLVHSSISFCNKVSVVNQHLYQYFSKIHKHVFYNNLAINTAYYTPKQSNKLHQPIRIFWTGSIGNSRNLQKLIPVLENINRETPLKFIMVCKANGGYTNTFIEHHAWETNTFFNYLADSDIALYPAWDDTELSRGKVAYKVLDYAASKVPVVASPFGLPQDLEDKKDVLVANNEDEWEAGIRELINNESLRKALAENAYQKLLQYHSVEVTYKNFLNILLS